MIVPVVGPGGESNEPRSVVLVLTRKDGCTRDDRQMKEQTITVQRVEVLSTLSWKVAERGNGEEMC